VAEARGKTRKPLSWPELIGLVMTGTGMTPAEIGAISMDHLGWMLQSWREFPPAHIAIDSLSRIYAAVHGCGDEPTTKPRRATREDCAGMFATMKGMAAHG
jgi:hypothetical protein